MAPGCESRRDRIKPLPELDSLPPELDGPVLLKVGESVSTDEILPAGVRVLPFRSNIPAISRFVFSEIDEHYVERAEAHGRRTSFVVAGANCGQGSSREHAALAPRYLGLRAVLAVSFARIHWHNLINFGIVPFTFSDAADWQKINEGDSLFFFRLRERVASRAPIEVINKRTGQTFRLTHQLSDRQIEVILAGSLISVAAARRHSRLQ
jgi:aconitate hydratase